MSKQRTIAAVVILACAGMPTELQAQSAAGESWIAQDGAVTAGKRLYRRKCVFCHGTKGRGDGPVARYIFPKPRDLTRGLFKIRSTPTGSLPTDQDLFGTLTRGLPGTTMPAWSNLIEKQRWQLVAYVKTLARSFDEEDVPVPIEIGTPKPPYPESVANGRRLYLEVECWKCHGFLGKGDGPASGDLTDDWDYPIVPADLTVSRNWRGGNRPQDIFRSIAVGIGGTPMPSWLDALSEDQMWDLTNYLLSIIAK
ncbi:MAG: c-type cytochrome [Gemmatimonadota bacterium]